MNQKGFAPILIILSIVLLLGVAGGAYYFGQSSVKSPASVSQTPVSTSQTSISPTQSLAKTTISPTPAIDETANWKTYTSTKLNLSFKYPSNYDMQEQTLGSPAEPFFGVDLSDEDTTMSLIGYATGRGAEGVIQTKEVAIGGNSAKEYIFGASLDKVTSLQTSVNNINGKGKDITIIFSSKNNNPISQEKLHVFDQILSTFKFLN